MKPVTWIFGYGSLMWDPGFDVAEAVRARLDGYARSFCMRSVEYRGTPERPGLVLALRAQTDATCNGLALRIPDADHDEVRDYLRGRELITGAYVEEVLPVTLDDGRVVDALAYVIRDDHSQFAGELCSVEQARIIATAQGGRGPNADYLFNTAKHLNQIGLSDQEMDDLSEHVRRLLEDAATDTFPSNK